MKPLTTKQIQKRIAKGKNFSEAYLKYAHLREQDLFKANFFRADLEGADLEAANLVRAHFLEANLEGANLVDAVLSEAYLEDANLYRADLEECDLRKADLKGANLRNANFKKAMLERADLEGAQAANANFSQAQCALADFSEVNLSFAQCFQTDFYKTNLKGALLKNGNFRECDFRLANLENADLENADLRAANLRGANLSGAILDGCKLDNSHLQRGIYPDLSARWIDLSPEGDGQERMEFDTEEFQTLMDARMTLFIDVAGILETKGMLGLTHFLMVMETLLPDLRIFIQSYHSFLNRTYLTFSFGQSAEPSIYSFCFFLIYQFANAESIDCALLEEMSILVQSPILSELLLKKRPLKATLINKILKMKKTLKVENKFFRHPILRFRYIKKDGNLIVMQPLKNIDRDMYSHRLYLDKEVI